MPGTRFYHVDKNGCREDVERILEEVEAGNIAAIFDNNPDELVELLETGSVTLKLPVGERGAVKDVVFTLGAWVQE